jgi:hypothetical protein
VRRNRCALARRRRIVAAPEWRLRASMCARKSANRAIRLLARAQTTTCCARMNGAGDTPLKFPRFEWELCGKRGGGASAFSRKQNEQFDSPPPSRASLRLREPPPPLRRGGTQAVAIPHGRSPMVRGGTPPPHFLQTNARARPRPGSKHPPPTKISKTTSRRFCSRTNALCPRQGGPAVRSEQRIK